MAKYPMSFPGAAMVVPDGEWEAVGRDAHAVIDETKAAGVYVFAGGIDAKRTAVFRRANEEANFFAGQAQGNGYHGSTPVAQRSRRLAFLAT